MTAAHPILVSERSGAIALLGQGGGTWSRKQVAAFATWPIWRPQGDSVAVSVVRPDGDEVRSAIELLALDGTHLRTLHQTAKGIAPVIAPRIPHYGMWSPQGDVLSYVAQSSYGLTLFLSDVAGAFVSDPIINGAPIFFSWCPDNNFLGVHAGDELAVVEAQGSRNTASVAPRAAGFRTPAFSDDANVMAYAVPSEPGVAIMRGHFQGTGGREVHRFPGGVALAFRPGTLQLTVAVTLDPSSGQFDELWSLDLSHEPTRAIRIRQGPFVAFFWAPGGASLALVVPAQTGDGRLSARLVDPAGRPLGASEAIVPSQDFRTVLGFFDQFSKSHHLWSPDGQAFLMAGRLAGGDMVSQSFGDPVGDYILLWPAERGAPIEVVAPGDIGFFPPPSPRPWPPL